MDWRTKMLMIELYNAAEDGHKYKILPERLIG